MKQVRLFLDLLLKVLLFLSGSLFIVVSLFVLLYPTIVQTGASGNVADTSFVLKYPMYQAFGIFCFFAFPEDFVFRLIPLGGCMAFDRTKKFLPYVALASSILFGLLHGNWVNIFIQGVTGMIFSLGFVMENKVEMGVIKALMFNIVVHAYYNLVLAFYWR